MGILTEAPLPFFFLLNPTVRRFFPLWGTPLGDFLAENFSQRTGFPCYFPPSTKVYKSPPLVPAGLCLATKFPPPLPPFFSDPPPSYPRGGLASAKPLDKGFPGSPLAPFHFLTWPFGSARSSFNDGWCNQVRPPALFPLCDIPIHPLKSLFHDSPFFPLNQSKIFFLCLG